MVGASGGPSLSQALSVKTKLAHLNLDGNLIGASGAASLSQVFFSQYYIDSFELR